MVSTNPRPIFLKPRDVLRDSTSASATINAPPRICRGESVGPNWLGRMQPRIKRARANTGSDPASKSKTTGPVDPALGYFDSNITILHSDFPTFSTECEATGS